jgi:hypothetical protein
MTFFDDIKIDNFINLSLDGVDHNLSDLKKIYKNENENYYKRMYSLYYVLDQYNSLNIQTGGKSNNTVQYGGYYTDTSIIDHILNDDNINFNIYSDNCTYDNYGNYNICMDTLIPISKQRQEYISNLNNYKIKRNIKSIVTDSFMNTLASDEKLYKILFDNTILQLYLCFCKCIYLYNIKKNILLTNKHIQLLYKGGNSTKFLINFYLSNTSISLRDEKKITNKLNIGDWDFTLKCNYYKLNELMNNEEIDDLLNYIKKSFIVALYNIKIILEKILLPNDKFNSKFIDKCSTNIRKNDINKICYNNNNKKSFIMSNNNITTEKVIKKISIVDNLLTGNSELVKLNLKTSKIFIAYINEISSYAFKTYVNFSLFRLKINNDIKNITDNTLNNFPIEFIDLSIPNKLYVHNHKEFITDALYNLLILWLINDVSMM